MAGGQERVLRRRIRSVQSTMKITRAFELIAASRIVKAQRAIAAARPYVEKMGEVVTEVASSPELASHPLLRENESGVAAIIVFTADRGLAGGYNASVLRAAERLIAEKRAAGSEVSLIVIGRKAEAYFRYHNRPLTGSVTGIGDQPGFGHAREIVAMLLEPLAAGDLSSVDVVYTRFHSMSSQSVAVRNLLPLGEHRDRALSASTTAAKTGVSSPTSLPASYELEPDDNLLERLVPKWLEAEILGALLDSAASEHAARQRAMKAATDNADELIKNLRRVMNRARQDAITTEIMEIVGGAEALRQGQSADGFGAHHEGYEPPAAQTA